MGIVITSLIGGIVFSGAVFAFRMLLLRRQTDGASAAEMRDVETKCAEIGNKIDQAVKQLQKMASLDDYLHGESRISELREELAAERQKLEKLDKQVEKMQTSVEAEEAAHNALKKGKDEAVALAADVRTNKERLGTEVHKLEEDLETSLAELNALSSEVGLTVEQQQALDKIGQTLDQSRKQLRSLSDTYNQASTRFTNLEAQFVELEKEYTKLVEKELSGAI